MNQNRLLTWAARFSMISALVVSSLASANSFAYQLDKTNHTITVSPSGDYTSDIRAAFEYLRTRSDYQTWWTFKFNPGKYYMKRPIYGSGLKYVDFVSTADNPAMLIKADGYNESEYLIYLTQSEHIKLRNFEFYGKTSFKDNSNPVWNDQGVLFGSCKTVLVDNNHFYNFGNAALRVTTSEKDPIKGVNSFDTTVSNNTFNNVYQISTTSNDMEHGGTARYWMKNNKIVNLRGSVKFASRTPGAKDVHVLNNVINGGDHYALEIDNYDNMEINGNTLQNIKEIAMNIYTNPRVPKGFNWGSNFNITNNYIQNCKRGIRFSPDPSADGYKPIPSNLIITKNNIKTLTETDKFIPAISVVNGTVEGVKITDNKMYSIQNKNYIGVAKACQNVIQSNNIAEGQVLGQVSGSLPPGREGISSSTSTSTSTRTASTGKPAAPSNLSAKYDGNLKVILTWNDNASNETSQEVWGSWDGKNYSRIATLYKNSEKFTHTMKRVPSNPNFYYSVRAVNNSGPSPFGNNSKVVFPQEAASAQ